MMEMFNLINFWWNINYLSSFFFLKQVKYSKILGVRCKKKDTGRRYENLNQAKLDCSSDPDCRWIWDEDCQNDVLYLCSSENGFDSIEGSCVHSKTEIIGIHNEYNRSFNKKSFHTIFVIKVINFIIFKMIKFASILRHQQANTV